MNKPTHQLKRSLSFFAVLLMRSVGVRLRSTTLIGRARRIWDRLASRPGDNRLTKRAFVLLMRLVELQAGPVVAYTGQSALADPSRLDEAGLPMTLPLEIPDVWSFGAMGRAQVLFEARVADGFVLALGPYAGLAVTDGMSVQAGLVLRPAWVTGGWL